MIKKRWWLIKKEWWPHIVKYIFWGLVLGVFPVWTSYLLKRYENYSSLSQFILTQGLQPYRTKQIECNRKNFSMINSVAEELEYWKLLKILSLPATNLDMGPNVKVKDRDEFIFITKQAFKTRSQLDQKIDELTYCHNESIYEGDNLAMLLSLSSDYQKIFDELQGKLKNTAKNQEVFFISMLDHLNLTTSDNLPNWDKINDFAINSDKFFQKTNSSFNSMLELNINRGKKQLIYTVEYYNAWVEFYTKTSRLFVQAYQKRLS
jgi:hypothetical protein